MPSHHFFIGVRGRQRMLPRYGVIMTTVSNNCIAEHLHEFAACLEYLPNGLRTSRVVISGMDPMLVNGGSGAHYAERIEQMHPVSIFRQANSGCGAVDAGPGNSDF